MSIYTIIFIIIIFGLLIPIAIYLKIRSWGIDSKITRLVMSTFIYSIPKLHINLYNKHKIENKKLAFKFLLLPISNPKLVLALYSKATILAEAKYKAIESIIPTLNKKELKIFIGILNKENLELNIKHKKLKKINIIENKKYEEKVTNKKLWENVFKQEIGETIQSQFQLKKC